MKRFSERMGYKQSRNKFQMNSVDDALRNRLWNVVSRLYFAYKYSRLRDDDDFRYFVRLLYHEYFKRTFDTIGSLCETTYMEIRDYFLNCEWYEVYDFLEFIANIPIREDPYTFDLIEEDEVRKRLLIQECNKVLEQEMSGYRFVGYKIAPIINNVEIVGIGFALKEASKISSIFEHLDRSLGFLADRKSPDYRKSIEEAILSVEAICKIITNENNATLGQALKRLKDKGIQIHRALENAFASLYGYTSNEGGIRHAKIEWGDVGLEDAKFMLVTCAAFVSYLIAKAGKAGISLE